MIRAFVVFIFFFAAAFFLPLSEPVGIDFLDYDLKVQLWFIVFALILLVFCILFIMRIFAFITGVPSRFQSMNYNRKQKQLIRYREKMLWEWMLARYDTLLNLYKRLHGDADWSDHVLFAVAALKEKSFLKFDEALIAMRECGFSDSLVQTLRLYLLSQISLQDVEMEMVDRLADRMSSRIVWHWVLNQSNLSSPVWFEKRRDARLNLTKEEYLQILPKLVSIALQSQDISAVYQDLGRAETADIRVVHLVMTYGIESHTDLCMNLLIKSFKRCYSVELYYWVVRLKDHPELIGWFLKYSTKKSDLNCLYTRCYILMLQDDKQVDEQMRVLMQRHNISEPIRESALVDVDNKFLVLLDLWLAKKYHHRAIPTASQLCHAEFSSKHFANI